MTNFWKRHNFIFILNILDIFGLHNFNLNDLKKIEVEMISEVQNLVLGLISSLSLSKNLIMQNLLNFGSE